MSTRADAWLALSLCLLCVVLAVASLILALLNGRTLGEIFLAFDGPSIAVLPTWTVSFSVVGALVASHRPKNPIGWIFLAEGFFYGLLSVADQYAIYALLTNPNSEPGVPTTAVPRRSPAFETLAPGGLARQSLHRHDCRSFHDSALAREGPSASDRR
jgi:hypothetical protein